LRLLRSANPDLAIVDISLARGSGLELVKQIRSSHPEVKTLVLSMHDEAVFAERALRAGALGYVNKAAPGVELLEAVHKVLRGELALSSTMTDRLLRSALGAKQPKPSGVERLSDRELEVFELIGQGRSTGQIADGLGVSVKTVETHCQTLKKKLGAASINELRRQATLFVEKSG
jgi:DNA-binding NarL/FixJ family response regulator